MRAIAVTATGQPRPHRWRRRIGIGLLALALVSAALLGWKPSRVTLQAAMLIPSLIDAGPQPLNLISAAPRRETIAFRADAAAAADRADMWIPADASANHRAGGMVLILGVNNVGRRYPAVVRFGEAMARTGIAVLIPDSASLLAGTLSPGDVDMVVEAFTALAARPEVDPARIGLVGLSVGGSLSLLAAGDSRIAARVAWVNAFGAYANAGEYLAEVASHAFRVGGRVVTWTPAQLTLDVFARMALSLVDDVGDRQLLADGMREAVLSGSLPRPDAALAARLQSEAGRAIYALLTAGSLDHAERMVAALPAAVHRLLDDLSPDEHLDALRTRIFLMHDTADAYVPYGESRRLSAELQQRGLLGRATELRVFEHVEPKGVDLVGAAPQLWTLLWHLQAVLTDTL